MNDKLIQNFGFSEMYEFSDYENIINKHGRFVQFDDNNPDKITLCTNENKILGITTINSVIDSDDPNIWCETINRNEYGDAYMKKEIISIGEKVYDQLNELAYIKTKPYINFTPVINENFDKNKKYIKRSLRKEWVRVNLLGKCIVEDNGKCIPGKYCTLYKGKDSKKYGTAIPATTKSIVKFYVLKRLSDKSILILNK